MSKGIRLRMREFDGWGVKKDIKMKEEVLQYFYSK